MQDEDVMRELLELDDSQLNISDDHLREAEALARTQWEQTVQSRRERSRRWIVRAAVAVAASLLVAIGVGYFPHLTAGLFTDRPAAVVEVLRGDGWLAGSSRSEHPVLLSLGQEIDSGSVVETGESGGVVLRLSTGHSVRLHRATVVALAKRDVLDLRDGAVYVDSGKRTAGERRIEVRTPFATIREVGTQYLARLSQDTLIVRVREGATEVKHRTGNRNVETGTELVLARDGAVRQTDVSRFGAPWTWVDQLTPPIELEGASVHELLRSATRQRGWELEYASREVARHAKKTEVTGLEADWTLDELLRTALVTSAMRHEVQDGVLTVSLSGN